MKKTMIAIAFAVASVPMIYAAQTAPATGTQAPATKTKKHTKKGTSKKAAPKKESSTPSK
jgi:hypothetical protein